MAAAPFSLICALNPICFSSSPWTGCSSISTLAVDQLHTDEDAQTDGLGTQRTLWSVLQFSPTWIISAHSPIISGNLCFHGTAGLLQQIALHLWLSASPSLSPWLQYKWADTSISGGCGPVRSSSCLQHGLYIENSHKSGPNHAFGLLLHSNEIYISGSSPGKRAILKAVCWLHQ